MKAQDALRSSMDMSLFVLKTYLGDLSDAELLSRPAAGCNHLAWQLGHLISSEVGLLKEVCPDVPPVELPEGFAHQHGKQAAGDDDAARFLSKQQYLELFDRVRANTHAALEKLSEADLDRPSPEKYRKMFPTVGSVFTLIATHPMMHAGQFVVVRRKLGKPVVI